MSNIITAGNATNNGTSISSDTSGVLELKTGSTPTTALTIDANQVVTVVNPIQGGTITSGTSVATTSGTAISYTSIPSWVKRITMVINGISTNGTSIMGIRIGSGSFDTTGYLGSVGATRSGASGNANYSASFALVDGMAAVLTIYGTVTLTLLGSNTWAFAGTTGRTDTSGSYFYGGIKVLSGALDRIQLTTEGGTNTFDAGSINILYE
jgi:hypothetical protein